MVPDIQQTCDKLIKLRNTLWGFQITFKEITEFYYQWDSIFDQLVKLGRPDAQVRISGAAALRKMNDALRILVVDVHGLIQNEQQNEFSALRVSLDLQYKVPEEAKGLEPGSVEAYFEHEVRAIRDRQRLDLQNIVGTEPCLDKLKSFLDELHKRLNSVRQIGAHRHQELMVKKHSEGAALFTPKELHDVLDELFKLVHLILSVYFEYPTDDIYRCDTSYIAEIVDQVLFGTVRTAYANYNPNKTFEHDKEARDDFFSTSRILQLIVPE